MKFGFALLSLTVALGAAAHEYSFGKLNILHPWSGITRGGLKTGAIYVTFVNDGPNSDKLLKVSSPIAKTAMIHANIKEGDVTRMRMMDSVEIPAGGTIEMQPGGTHIMLEGLDHPLKDGEMFPLTLTLANEGEVHVEVIVADN